MLDSDGVIRRANRAFLDLVEVGAKGSVVGERLARWLWRPGADLAVLLANVERHGCVRLFTTTIQGELGTDTEVEISAAGNDDDVAAYIGVLHSRRRAPDRHARRRQESAHRARRDGRTDRQDAAAHRWSRTPSAWSSGTM